MEDIIGGIAAHTAGGITGILGSIIGRGFTFFERRQAHKIKKENWANDEKVRAHDIALKQLDQAHIMQLHEANRQGVQEEHERAVRLSELDLSGQGLADSIADQTVLNGGAAHPIAKTAISMMRPLLTLTALIMLYRVWAAADDENRIVLSACFQFLAVASFLWWFGDRVQDKMQNMIFGAVK